MTTLSEEDWLKEYTVKRDAAITEIVAKGEATLASIPGDYAKLSSDVTALSQDIANIRNNYPWDKNADLGASRVGTEIITPLRNGVKDIRLYGANPRDKHYLSYIAYTDNTNRIISVYIKNRDDVTVCTYSKWYNTVSGVVCLPLNEENSSGVTGYIVIDFDAFTIGNAISYAPEYKNESMLSEFCYEAKHDEVKILLPNVINTVVGQELSIYFDNIILCNNLKNYQIDCACDVGKQQNERFVYTPASAGSHTLTVNVYKNYNQLVARASVTINAISATGNGMTKKVCLIGDSWTASVWYPSYLQERFSADGDNITLIGTIKPWGDYNGCPIIEGRAGWKATDYITKASFNGVSNAFWNPSAGKFDFGYYLSNNGLATPDVVTLFLGINDAGGTPYYKTIEAMQTMIDSILSVNPAAKIGVALLPPPCLSQDGLGAMNGTALSLCQQKRCAFELSQMYVEAFGDNDSVFFIPVMSAVDMVNNVPFEMVKANAYSDVEIKRVTDNVHCDKAGYQQVADMFYGALKALY